MTDAPQRWRTETKRGQDLLFNPLLDSVQDLDSEVLIVFIHVGKCAGTSIYQGIKGLLGQRTPILEYHCYDANERLNDLLKAVTSDGILASRKLAFVIATREPLRRWISAFNWDYTNLYLNDPESVTPRHRQLLQYYPTALDLASEISSGANDAIELGKYGHMGMGISWYLPDNSISLLEGKLVYTISQEDSHKDFNLFAYDITKRLALGNMVGLPAKLPRTHEGYLPSSATRKVSTLSEWPLSTIKHMREAYLQADVIAHDLARNKYSIFSEA